MNGHLLAIDAGNTRIKWGLHDGKEWISHEAVAIACIENSVTFQDMLKTSEIDCIVVSNVAGPSIAKLLEDQIRLLGKKSLFITAQASHCGVVNRYKGPAQLGSDRWAALIAARDAAKNAPRAQLVVMCGTALTVDALSASGQFLGGIIVPGLRLMRRALNRATAQLPDAAGEFQRFPTNTENAITTGAVVACAGAVDRMYAHLAEETGEVPSCICSGGAMNDLAPHLSFPLSINDNLVLDGLLVIANTPEFLAS